MIESILITNLSGAILFSKYYNETDLREIAEWEQTLYKLTNESWNNAKNQNHEVVVTREKYIVYTSVDELLVFITGSDEDDELALSPLLNVVIEVLRRLCKKGVLSQESFQEQYPSVCLSLSEVVQNGFQDHLDLNAIEGLDNLKLEAPKGK